MAFFFGGASAPAAPGAFSFGGAASAAPTPGLFSTASAAPTPGLFGASAPPAGGLFGTPVLGSAPLAPGLFGAAAAPASSAPPAGGLFGAAPAPAAQWGAPPPPSSGGLFGAPPPPASAAAPGGFLGMPPASASALFSAPPPAPGLFGQQQQQQQPQAQPPASSVLVTKDGRPATHGTQWDELAPCGQDFLLGLERTVAGVREAAAALEGDPTLFDAGARAAAPRGGRRALEGELARLGARVRADGAAADALRSDALALLRGAEAAVRGFQRADARAAAARAGAVGAALPPGVRDALAAAPPGPPDLPSRYLRTAVADLASAAAAQAALAGELARLVGGGPASTSAPPPSAASLATALHAAHATLLHVAARVERLHERAGAMRAAHSAALRARGLDGGPGMSGWPGALALPAPAAAQSYATGPSLLFGGGR